MPGPQSIQVPLFYRLFFTWIDPIICVWGAYMDFFDPALVLSSHIPNPTPDIGHAMILRQRGGGMLNFGFISAVLLRYTTDMTIWRIVQIADLVVDCAYFWAVHGALSAQARLGWQTWRAEDWGSLAITGAAAVARLCFLLRVGVTREAKGGSKKA
ncbi:hypothetical protein BU26DRAFT_515174 [Trematosphaeria pertusa]|uniref:DUF7704 domain-containing protein n=1 Tax=Trematosphaeria pertusa TaxID=390896 RepID=A0A6A6IY95_9PLEO|nr:uncharacterized protein BU26DRAFT_515174 [Trematosphaeria pertusa]KAF2255459.1 hypothetical protein BU26DRAFT_515174 [Trematosphaeria pertusa]